MRMLYPKEMSMMGVFLTTAGDPVQLKGNRCVALQNVVVMYATGMTTDDGQPIWESDIIDASVVTEFGSMLPVRGFMQWHALDGRWFLYIPKPPVLTPVGDFPVVGRKVSGNIYEQPDLLEQNEQHVNSR